MKPNHLLVVMSLLTVSQLTAQDNTAPQVVNQNDSLVIMKLLGQTRDIYLGQLYDSAISQSELILEISNDKGFQRGTGESYFLKARALNRLGRKEKAIQTYQLAVAQFESIGDHSRMASAYNNWGLILKGLGRFREAIETGEKALEHVKLTPASKLEFHILNNLGNSYRNLALFKNASSAYYKALQVLKNEQDSSYIQRKRAELYINLGLVYYEQKLYKESNDIFMKALKILKDKNIKPQLALVYNNLGILFTQTQDLNQAIGYLTQAYDLCLDLNNKVGATVCKSNLGKVFLTQKNYDKAILTYQQAIADFEELEAPAYLPSAYLGLGEALTKAGVTDKAEVSLLKGLQIALKSGQKMQELKIYEGLIMYHKSVDELEMALMYYDLYSALIHELNDQQIGRFIGQLELKELMSKRDLALKTLESEAAFLQFKLDQRNLLLVLSMTLIIMVLVIFTLLFRQYRLKAQNRNIELEQKFLRAQLNPHFIFNALGAIQHYMMAHGPEKAASYLSKFSKLMRAILECSRSSKTSLSMELKNIRHYLDLQSLRFSKPFQYHIEVDDRIHPDQATVPSLLLQPLLENAVEHGLMPNQGGELHIRFNLQNGFIKVEIEDDGIGVGTMRDNVNIKEGKTSLGNTIINERLLLINQKIKNQVRLNLKNKSSLDKNVTGTLTSFMIPSNY